MSKQTKSIETEIQEIMNDAAVNKAAEKGITPQEYIDKVKADVKMGNAEGTAELKDLVNLIVITHQERTLLRSDMWDFISQFIDAPNDQTGNGHRYIKHFIQEPKNYEDVKNKFVPDEFSKTAFSVQFIKFKNDEGNLEDGSVQKVFDAVYSTVDMITYFINGQLPQFISDEIIGKIGDSVVIYMYDFIMKKLVEEKGKVVNGTAKDMFAAFTTEIFPEIEEMKLNSSDYNTDNTLTQAIDASRREDLILLCSQKVNTMLKSNIMSQLFNSANIQISNFVGSVHITNRKFKYTNGVAGTEQQGYLDDNTIIVIDKKNYFKCLKMLKFAGEQDYPYNMSKLQVLHLWLASGYIKWGKSFVYKNNNLTVSPSNVE